MVAVFEYWQSEEDGQWYFHLKAPNNGIIVQSAGYTSEQECLEGINKLKYYADLAIITPKPLFSLA